MIGPECGNRGAAHPAPRKSPDARQDAHPSPVVAVEIALRACRHGLTIREMAADTGVGPKTIRRDLDLFRALGFPLEEATGEFGEKRGSWVTLRPAAAELPLRRGLACT